MKPKVLVMDDDVAISKIITLLLNRLGYEVVCVPSGEECIALYERAMNGGNRFNVVILDLTVLNGMGGMETIKKLKALDPNVVAVMASGSSVESFSASFEKYGFTAALPKPFRLQDVTDCMQKLSPQKP